MASDLSSECTETIGVLDEKEEGEISLEDVSSSEEGHLNYGYGTRVSQCSNCLSTQHNAHASWCTASAKFYASKGSSNRREVDLILQDAVQGKENRHQIKESGCIGAKHTVSTLQEKNDDLVPISSDSDMEIVGLADNTKQIVIYSASKSKVKKKRKKKRNHATVMSLDDLVSSSTVDMTIPEDIDTLKHDVTKTNSSRSHRREISPINKNSRSRVIPRSPPRRHRSLVRTRSPFRRSKSPITHTRSPIRRSPRRLKSPRRSPHRSSGKTVLRKTSHPEVLSSSHNYVDTHKLLKKVRKLDSIGTHSLKETLNKNKEHASSLKEKLTNMMKGVSDNNNDATNSSKEKSTDYVNKQEHGDADDDEDLALLRQKALETKQHKSNKLNDQPKIETTKKINPNINDDQDEEDLELRMIALRSAVLKKHQNRVQKGIKSGIYKKCNISRSESPFTQSFLDSIPIPGEELLNFASPPRTPLPMNENNHTEDMDIDTDVEREKEKLPYSPTDNITTNISVDTELLGIQPSDVSFINLNEVNNTAAFNAAIVSSQDNQTTYQGKIIENRSYLPNVVYYTPLQNSICATMNTSIQYPQTDSTEASKSHFMKVHSSHVNEHHYEDKCHNLKSNNVSEFSDINSTQEMPYSPTDTPVYDPDLSHTLPQILGPITTSNSSLVSSESCNSSTNGSKKCDHILTAQQPQTIEQINYAPDNEQLNKGKTLPLEPLASFTTTPLMESVSPSSSMITIDDLPEVDADANPVADSIAKDKSKENIPKDLNNAKETNLEPLYMKGIPDITKDANKIPTLINRTLVPAPILKTNKQLQQPFSAKKSVISQEPTFKSAEMQPVIIDKETAKTNTAFKPIKLMSFPQKSHSVSAIPTVFHDSSHEEIITEISKHRSSSLEGNCNLMLGNNNVTANIKDLNETCDNKSPIQKKKKHVKKGLKRKSTSSLTLATKKTALCTSSDNINIENKKIYETSEIIYSVNKQNNEASDKQGVKNNTSTSISKASQNITIQKDNISAEGNEKETQSKDISFNETIQETQNTESRRESVDEDEEALRAILLASLPKRTKPTHTVSDSSTVTTGSVVSTAPTQVFINPTESKTGLPVDNTVNTTNINNTCLINVYSSENDKNQSNSKDKISNIIPQGNSSVEPIKTLSHSIASGRKKLLSINKGPQKKLLKRIVIPASTKVVNNAKKYQNSMLQKKLNLQKAVYNKQKIVENKITSKIQSNDNKWSSNTKILPDAQRIVINLESDSESDSESEQQKTKTVSVINSPMMEKSQSTTNSTTEFEKNLDQFLRAVRKKQESLAAARPTSISQTPKKDTMLTTKLEKSNSSNLHTPLAVRHLPASQQEEYRRLKQQILEREKLKLNSSIKNKNSETSSKFVLINSPHKELHSKVNQATFIKNQTVNVQQLNKENCSKNLDSIKDTSVSSTNNIQLSTNKTCTMSKQENINLKQTKTMTNLNICVYNENNANKISDNLMQSRNVRKVFEVPTHKIQAKTKSSPSLKILSSDEVNQRYVQIQVKNDTNERVVTINDKVTLNNKTVISRSENIAENKDSNNKNTHDNETNQITQSVEKEVVSGDTPCSNNNIGDSDASTIILSRENQNMAQRECNDTFESTVRLSGCQNDSHTSTNTEIKDNSQFSLSKNKSSNDKISIEENWEAIKRGVRTELSTLINLSREEQEKHLTDTEQKLVMKRYTILDDLAEMSSNIRQWHMERDLQANLAAEVNKLREQLKVAEERLQLQRDRINNIGPKVVATHGKINAGRQECFKLTTICSTLGNRIVGKDYKVPEAGAQLLNNRLKEVANHTRQLSRKKVPSIDIPEIYDSSKLGDETVSAVYTEISQSESLLSEKPYVNNVDTTIFNEDERLTKSNKIEDTSAISLEITTVHVNEEPSEQGNAELSTLTLTDNDKNMPEQNNIEKEVFSERQSLNSSHLPTPSISNSKNDQDLNRKESSESNAVKSGSAELCVKQINSTKPAKELQTKKILLPYESILTHLRVPRNTDPNGVLCPYELMGTCSDGDCQFIHQTNSQAK